MSSEFKAKRSNLPKRQNGIAQLSKKVNPQHPESTPDQCRTYIRKSFGVCAQSAKKYLQMGKRTLKEKFSTSSLAPIGDHVVQMATPEMAKKSSKTLQVPPKTHSRRLRHSFNVESNDWEDQQEEKPIERHAWGRWSYPTANSLILRMNAEDAKPQKVTPLRPLKPSKRPPPTEHTPKRTLSSNVARKNIFGRKESFRRLSGVFGQNIKRRSRIPVLKPIKNANKSAPLSKLKDREPLCQSGRTGRCIAKRPAPSSKPVRRCEPVTNNCLVVSTSVLEMKNPQQVRAAKPARKTLAELFREFNLRGWKDKNPKDSSKTMPAWRSFF